MATEGGLEERRTTENAERRSKFAKQRRPLDFFVSPISLALAVRAKVPCSNRLVVSQLRTVEYWPRYVDAPDSSQRDERIFPRGSESYIVISRCYNERHAREMAIELDKLRFCVNKIASQLSTDFPPALHRASGSPAFPQSPTSSPAPTGARRMANHRNEQESYDSSASHFLNQTTGGGINPAGNLTTGQLGDLAESFHSEDFDQGDLYRKPTATTSALPLGTTGDAGEEAKKAMRLKEREREARRKEDNEDFSSLLDQQEDDPSPVPRYASVIASNPFTNSLTAKQQQGSTFGHNSATGGGGGKAAALFELSTVISEASEERKGDSRDDSVMLKEGLGKNVEDSMVSDNVASPRIVMGSRMNQLRPAASKSALGGKKEGKAKKETKQPQHLSLRDQENVRFSYRHPNRG